ncbi:hypothetical protein J3R83DRAFT_6728 [Lanmaoa asiatica]|nr:hypothetical protein J3R83DRAFT_6728 [Lanmaoa asiatica]
MSTSETDSEPEPELAPDTVSSLTTFAHLSATRPDQVPTSQGTVSWAVDTLAMLDFRLVRKDTALHGLIHNCASTILAMVNTVLEPATDSSCGFIPDVASILRPSFLYLLFQYRRLFRVIATRDLKLGSAPLAIVCWVDVVLAKLGDVAAFIAGGLDRNHPNQSLPESLKAQREEDNLRAAIQLPDNWDMLPSILLSERVSVAAKRLSIRLMLGSYILCPALSGQVDYGAFHSIHKLFSTFAEFVRQSAARVDGLHSILGPGLRYLIQQERLTGAMAISLFAAADIAQGSTTSFRPQTMAAAMQLLRSVLNDGEYPTQTNVLSPLDHLDIPTSVIIRWGIVPQWTWTIWLEYRSLHADTIIGLTTAYIQHYRAGTGVLLEASSLISTNSRLSDQAAVISVMIVRRFISVLSAGGHSKQLSTGMMGILHESCRLISQWMNRNSCGIQNSKECCKALLILFGYLSQNEQYFALNELVIESLALMKGQCTREAWKAANEDDNFHFLEALGQGFVRTKTTLSQDDLPKFKEIHATQLMQFLVVMISKGVQPLDLDAFVEFTKAVGERVLEMPLNDRGILCETFLTCLATANLSEIDLPFSKANVAANDEVIWHLGMCNGDADLFIASAFSLYITSALVGVEPLTYLEGLEYLLDMALLICSRHYLREDEPLALIVIPTICDALAHLLVHRDDTTGVYTRANPRISALCSVLRSLGSREDSMCDGYGALLKRRLSSTARRVLQEMEGEPNGNGDRKGKREYELVFCRLNGFSHLLLYSLTLPSVSMSSPFALSCRRRSHSASSPSPSPAPASSWRSAHKRAHSSHRDTPTLPDSQRCHLDIWRTGKRPRRDISPAQATRSSTPASADSRSASSGSSAPHTPIFPASSADFLLFPGHPLCGGNLTTRNPRSPSSTAPFLHDDACESSQSELARLRSAAFLELQRSVQENGEGFVKRMREFEDSRSKSAQHSRARGIERRRRKRYSPSAPTASVTGKSTASDGDDDVLILSSALAAEPFHPRQKRSSSLGAMDDSNFQLHGETSSSGRLSPISSIFHPIPFAHYASHVHSNTTNQSPELSTSFSTPFDFTNPLHTNAFKPALFHSSSNSLASTADMSLSTSYAEDANYPSSSLMASSPQSPCHLSVGAILTSASSTEKAIAALTLAMANGAGGLGDYAAVRALNVSSADESQAGELWH